jgi:hypothetical protein
MGATGGGSTTGRTAVGTVTTPSIAAASSRGTILTYYEQSRSDNGYCVSVSMLRSHTH